MNEHTHYTEFEFPKTREEITMWALETTVPAGKTWFEHLNLDIAPYLNFARLTIKWISYVCENMPDTVSWEEVADADKIIVYVAGVPVGKLNTHNQNAIEVKQSSTVKH